VVLCTAATIAQPHSSQDTTQLLLGHHRHHDNPAKVSQDVIPHTGGQSTPAKGPDSTLFDFATTTIDILSSSPNHTIFIHLLQRTKLIPTLNLIPESTIFAPVDEAWRKWSEEEDGKDLKMLLNMHGQEEELEILVADNILFHLRQHLLYHVLNYTLSIPIEFQPSPFITTESTLLYPSRKILRPSPAPPPNSPWLPQGGTGSLGGQGQKVRVEFEKDGVIAVGGRANGEEGVGVWDEWLKKEDDEDGVEDGDEEDFNLKIKTKTKKEKEKKLGGARMASNGVVVGLQEVLRMPRDISELV
jgi:solute carrier family 25 (mitochondrial carnitine/acylcarnitine transporter), member 20/29